MIRQDKRVVIPLEDGGRLETFGEAISSTGGCLVLTEDFCEDGRVRLTHRHTGVMVREYSSVRAAKKAARAFFAALRPVARLLWTAKVDGGNLEVAKDFKTYVNVVHREAMRLLNEELYDQPQEE